MPTEIERKYLLDRLPTLPEHAQIWRIEQGYLNQSDSRFAGASPNSEFNYGRIRRVTLNDGTIICTHTIKRGMGLVRDETERAITVEQFQELWGRTRGRRLRKVRYRVREQSLIWEIDDIAQARIVLAEIELPAVDAAVPFPDWLKPHVAREVTDDPAFTNASIAQRLNQED